MNIFQQVFASVDPKASQLVKVSENVNENVLVKKEKETIITDNQLKVKKTSKKDKKTKPSNNNDFTQVINAKPKIDFKPPTSQQQTYLKSSASVIPVRKVQKNKIQSNDSNRKNQQNETEIKISNDEILYQIKQLEEKYENLCEQYNNVANSYNKSQVNNEKLTSQNFELEMEIKKLKDATNNANDRLLEMKQEHEDKAKERDESWEFKINELMMELEVLKDSKK